jgi:hypothetical protein
MQERVESQNFDLSFFACFCNATYVVDIFG